VLISIDPALRDRLLEAFKVNTVLDNLIIGLPEYAIAVNKETLKIEATTGLGYKGSSIEEMGITEDMLANSFNGFLMIDGKEYYAGVSKSADYYLVPVVRRTSNLQAFKISMKLVIVMAVSAIVIILLTLFRYKKTVIDSYPKEEIPDAEPETEDEMKTELFESLLVLPKLRAQEKSGMEDRWHMNNVPKDQQTPEERIARSVYRLLLLFCLLILVPTLYDNLQDGSNPNKLNNLAYVISGNWQKGFNIFAVTSCIFLMSSMYVVGMMLNQILYRIAKVSDMRVETICLLLRNASKYICVIMFVYYGLAKFGVDTQTLLASAGIVSLMISFGAKDLVSDIIAGFFTIFEGTYKVGDFITVGNWFGTVVEIGLRTTKVRFFAETKIFSNSSIRDIINADGTVTRMTLKAPFPYDADLLEIENILKEELPQIAERIDGLVKPPKYEGVESLGESSVSLMISILVEMPKKKAALRQLNREILLMYKRRGIAVPYNQIVVHNANDSENRSIIIKDKEQV
jgi:small conductance mechanosensitive channel